MNNKHTCWMILFLSLLWFPESLIITANVARGKPAYQYDGNSDHAVRAVDGNTDPNDSDTCTFIDTGDNAVSAWWYVDLGSVYNIHSLTVYNTNSEPEYLHFGDFMILGSSEDHSPLSNSKLCQSFFGTLSRGRGITLSCTVSARYIIIQKKNNAVTRNHLTLCEVVVTEANNVARDKPANQNDGNSDHAVRAVDGNTDPNDSDTCTFIDTGDNAVSAWWYVDLGSVYGIHSVTVYNTNSEPEYLHFGDFMILGSSDDHSTLSNSTVCHTLHGTPSRGQRSTLSCTLSARYIIIQKKNSSVARNHLTLCEVVVVATTAMSCGDLSGPENGAVSIDSLATYSCNEGYDLVGNVTRECLGGSWSGSSPQCKVKNCGELSNPNNGKVTYSDTTYQSMVTYNCDTGFELVGDETRTCSAEGTWTGSQPKCREAVNCPAHCECVHQQCQMCELWYVPDGTCNVYLKLPTLDASFEPTVVEVTQTTAVIKFKQDVDDVPDGYENHYYYQLLYKTESNAFEIWEDSNKIEHIPGEFGVTFVAHSLTPGITYTFKQAIYRTHRAETQKGSTDSRTVTVNTLPSTDCQDLPNPENGRVSYQDTSYNSVATYTCNEGFTLIGEHVRQCSVDGIWTGDRPECKVCPQNCECDENLQCQRCHLWYVPDRFCNMSLKPGGLSGDPILLDVSETTALVRILQTENDIPEGYSNHYFYRLLSKHGSFFEVLQDSHPVHHDASQRYINLTARSLSPNTSYTLKIAIYRTHRGEIQKGTSDSNEITLKTRPATNSTDQLQVNDEHAEALEGRSKKILLVLAVLFGILFLISLVLNVIFIAKRYFVHAKKTPKDESPDSVENDHQTLKPTYENITLQTSGHSHANPAGDNDEIGYTSMTSETRAIPRDLPYTDLYQELHPKE